MRLRILIACECSGEIRRAMRAAGHDAWSCDMKDAEDGSPFHIKGDAIAAMARGCYDEESNTYVPWDLVIAHPTCTRMSNSGALRLYKDGKKVNGPDPVKWLELEHATDFFAKFAVEYDGPLCLENPVMHGHAKERVEAKIGPERMARFTLQSVQPFNFGEDASKETILWLRGLPALKSTGYFPPRMVCRCGGIYAHADRKTGCPSCGETEAYARPRWSNQTDSGQNRLAPSAHRASDRARTVRATERAPMAESPVRWLNNGGVFSKA